LNWNFGWFFERYVLSTEILSIDRLHRFWVNFQGLSWADCRPWNSFSLGAKFWPTVSQVLPRKSKAETNQIAHKSCLCQTSVFQPDNWTHCDRYILQKHRNYQPKLDYFRCNWKSWVNPIQLLPIEIDFLLLVCRSSAIAS
jgi:hypothetical protein